MKRDPVSTPKPSDIITARELSRLTQTDAASLIYCNRGTWAKWESGDRAMHPAFFELFTIKSKQESNS